MIALKVKKGSTFSRKCSYSSGGSPVNLTGSTIRASVRDNALQSMGSALSAPNGLRRWTCPLLALVLQENAVRGHHADAVEGRAGAYADELG